MISHEYKCIFVHIPKTGGYSILDAFDMNFIDENSNFLNTGLYSSVDHWGRYYWSYRDYLTFSVVRNPWDRFISAWKYICNRVPYSKYKDGPKTNELENRDLLDILKNMPTNYYSHDWLHLTLSQYDMLYTYDGCVVDKIIKFENLQNEFDDICDIIGKPRRTLKKLNSTERKHYREYFTTQEHLDLFYDRYKNDIEKLGYEF
jgi:hypothetical protein